MKKEVEKGMIKIRREKEKKKETMKGRMRKENDGKRKMQINGFVRKKWRIMYEK